MNKCNTNNKNQSLHFISLKLQNLLGASFPHNCSTRDYQLEHISFFQQQIEISYDLRESEMEAVEFDLLRDVEKAFMLQQIDNEWAEHLQKIAFLRESIKWIAYAQKNPLTEYKKEAFNYFNIMLTKIRHRVIFCVFQAKIILQ